MGRVCILRRDVRRWRRALLLCALRLRNAVDATPVGGRLWLRRRWVSTQAIYPKTQLNSQGHV